MPGYGLFIVELEGSRRDVIVLWVIELWNKNYIQTNGIELANTL